MGALHYSIFERYTQGRVKAYLYNTVLGLE